MYPWLKEFGFTQSQHDSSLFYLSKQVTTPSGPRHERFVIGVYIDDLATRPHAPRVLPFPSRRE